MLVKFASLGAGVGRCRAYALCFRSHGRRACSTPLQDWMLEFQFSVGFRVFWVWVYIGFRVLMSDRVWGFKMIGQEWLHFCDLIFCLLEEAGKTCRGCARHFRQCSGLVPTPPCSGVLVRAS